MAPVPWFQVKVKPATAEVQEGLLAPKEMAKGQRAYFGNETPKRTASPLVIGEFIAHEAELRFGS